MAASHRAPRRLVRGTDFAPRPGDAGGKPENAGSQPAQPGLAYLRTSPEELGLIGAELTKRLTLAAEDFLSELAADQVRGSFRQELGTMFDGGSSE